jgi:hypothetical protein
MEWQKIADDWRMDLGEYRGHVFERSGGGYIWNLTESNNLVAEGFGKTFEEAQRSCVLEIERRIDKKSAKDGLL